MRYAKLSWVLAISALVTSAYPLTLDAYAADAGTKTGTTAPETIRNNSWSVENSYWRKNFASKPYSREQNYALYEPAYRYGVEIYGQGSADRRYDDIDEAQLQRGWDQAKGNSPLSWEQAKLATRDAYNRMYENNRATVPGSAASSLAPASR